MKSEDWLVYSSQLKHLKHTNPARILKSTRESLLLPTSSHLFSIRNTNIYNKAIYTRKNTSRLAQDLTYIRCEFDHLYEPD